MSGKALSTKESAVYLTYLDDGGKDAIKVFGGVIVRDGALRPLETDGAVLIHNLFPEEKRHLFKEFHASDMFLGNPPFDGIPLDRLHETMRKLIERKNSFSIPYVYSAVDMLMLNRSAMKSAQWIDIAFRLSAPVINMVVLKEWQEFANKFGGVAQGPSLHLMVIDEPEKREIRQRLRDSFRDMRPPIVRVLVRDQRPDVESWSYSSPLIFSVDDLFFGSSSDSIGLQLADVCNWVMWRHLCNEDTDGLYDELIKGKVECAKPEPEWSQYKHLLKSHDPGASSSELAW